MPPDNVLDAFTITCAVVIVDAGSEHAESMQRRPLRNRRHPHRHRASTLAADKLADLSAWAIAIIGTALDTLFFTARATTITIIIILAIGSFGSASSQTRAP